MTVICPKCNKENKLPETLDRKIAYRCHVCKKRFDGISNTNFGIAAALALVAWWATPALAWASALIDIDNPYINQEFSIAVIVLMLSIVIGVIAIVVTAYFSWEGVKHRRFTGVSPRSFPCFILISMLGACTCFTASGLAYAWYEWWA